VNFVEISAKCVSDCCDLMPNIHHDVKLSMSFRDEASIHKKFIYI